MTPATRPDSPAALRLRHRADALAGRLPPLLVEAFQVAATVAQGIHGRRRVGPGEEFWQYRRYESGDPVRRIDWRRSARSDVAYVREEEWAAAQSVYVWRDASASMDWASAPALPTKRDRAELLLLALAVLLVRGGERLARLGTGEIPSTGEALLERYALALPAEPAAADDVPPSASIPSHARVVLIGDWLADPDRIESTLLRLRGSGVRGYVLQVLDPAEETLPYEGRVRFDGVEGDGSELVPRVESLREAYVARLAARRAALTDLTRRMGWGFGTHRTDRPPQAALLALHQALAPRR